MKNKITKPSAKISTLQLSAYGEQYHELHCVKLAAARGVSS